MWYKRLVPTQNMKTPCKETKITLKDQQMV